VLSKLQQVEDVGDAPITDAGMGGAPTILYSGPTAKNTCVAKKCHDGRLDAAIAAKFAAAAAAVAAAGGTGTAATGGAGATLSVATTAGDSSADAAVQP
jgi:hypothetical protein